MEKEVEMSFREDHIHRTAIQQVLTGCLLYARFYWGHRVNLRESSPSSLRGHYLQAESIDKTEEIGKNVTCKVLSGLVNYMDFISMRNLRLVLNKQAQAWHGVWMYLLSNRETKPGFNQEVYSRMLDDSL